MLDDVDADADPTCGTGRNAASRQTPLQGRERGMLRDVNRSLLVWPAAASAAIVAGTWLQQPTRLEGLRERTLAAQAHVAAWWVNEPGSQASAPQQEGLFFPSHNAHRSIGLGAGPELAERRDRGLRGRRTSDRLVQVLTPDHPAHLAAPRLDEQGELAGLAGTLRLVLEPPRVASTGRVEEQPLTQSPLGPRPDARDFSGTPGPPLLPSEPKGRLASHALAEATSHALAKAAPHALAEATSHALAKAAPHALATARRELAARAPLDGPQDSAAPANLPVGLADDRSENADQHSENANSGWKDVNAGPAGIGPAGMGPAEMGPAERLAETEELQAEGAVEEPRGDAAVIQSRSRGVSSTQGGWPFASRLEQQLQAVARMATRMSPAAEGLFVGSSTMPIAVESPAARWSHDVGALLRELRELPELGDPRGGELIEQLNNLAAIGLTLAEQRDDRQEQLEWLRAGHALTRRLAVWGPVWQLTRHAESSGEMIQDGDFGDRLVENAIDQVRGELDQTGDPDGWARYLLLQQLERASESSLGDDGPRTRERALLSQRFLSRLQWHGLQSVHREWLDRESISRLAEAVRPWNRTAIDYPRLLDQLERQENDSIDLASLEIADAVQALRFAEQTKAAQISEAINAHYRNANVRVAISGLLLERLLPEVEQRTVPIRAFLFGSRIRGVSDVESDLRLRLVPAADRWSLELQSVGQVQTRSIGRSGPVAVRTAGQSRFLAAKPIEVTGQGVQTGSSDVNVSGDSRLRAIQTDYDGWPLIGSLVRGIASSRYEELKPQTDRYSTNQVQNQVGSEIDSRVEEAIDGATERLTRSLLGPLGKLRLDPMVVDLETTDERLLSRYRLAGDWQLASYTPRPRAPRSSLMSLQIHQSAINNTLERLAPRDESRSIEAMAREVLDLFERPETILPDEIPTDVMIQFASTRPVTVEIEEGILWITMRVVRLSQPDRLDLRRFIVRAAYRPQIDGLQAMLVRDGHLSISGPEISMRERLPVRAIFNKLFSPNRPLPLNLPAITEHPALDDVVVSQFELRDGWIGLALSPRTAPRIALQTAD